jgi:3-ketosteroid 9alpha-monooxygenase subunit B
MIAVTVSVTLDGMTRVLDWQPGARLLDVLLAAGLDAPYSCREGHCGSCCCQLVAGQVAMVNNEVLDEADLAAGYILACQSVPVTPEVRITY